MSRRWWQRRSPDRPRRPLHWSVIWLIILALSGGMGTAALLWLTSLPPLPDCQNTAQLTLDMERLYCAQDAARSGDLDKLVAGVKLLSQWTPDHPLYPEAQRQINEWSRQILLIARSKVRQNDLAGAVAAINHIPKSSPVHAEAQDAIAFWRKLWQQGETVVAKAKAAMKQQKWDVVSEQINLLSKFEQDYWRFDRAEELAQQLGVERQARQKLVQAQKLAASGNLAQISAAIGLAQQVPPKTYAAADVGPIVKQWTTTLVKQAADKWQQGRTEEAAAVLQLPRSLALTPELADAVKLGDAYRLASAVSSRWEPTPKHLWNLREAIGAMQQIRSDSPFYAQAQSHLTNWQAQLEDTLQLQYASFFAGLGQTSTYELAIAQAEQVKTDRPRRRQAQTLIAYWANEVERLQDEPDLNRAIAEAKAGTIAALKTAIQQASQIATGRSLRSQAQSLISGWQRQIQTIEDQPMLDQARLLAEQGNLNGAIDKAEQINPGRALHNTAQAEIADWQNQIMVNAQIAQDRPILDRAAALANRGDWTAAINTAAQIDSSRALYGEAQAAIADWRAESAPKWTAPIEPSTEPDTDPATDPATLGDNATEDPPSFDWNQPLPDPNSAPTESAAPESSSPSPIDSPPSSPDSFAPDWSAPDSSAPDQSAPSPTIVPTEPTAPEPVIVEPPPEPAPVPTEDAAPAASPSSFDGYYDPSYYNNSAPGESSN